MPGFQPDSRCFLIWFVNLGGTVCMSVLWIYYCFAFIKCKASPHATTTWLIVKPRCVFLTTLAEDVFFFLKTADVLLLNVMMVPEKSRFIIFLCVAINLVLRYRFLWQPYYVVFCIFLGMQGIYCWQPFLMINYLWLISIWQLMMSYLLFMKQWLHDLCLLTCH